MAIKKLIGSDKNQISLNRDFGTLAWQDASNPKLGAVVADSITTTGNVNLGQTASALQSGGSGLTLYGTAASEIKFLNNTTGNTATDGTAFVTSGGNFVINNRESGFVSIGTSNTTRVTVTADGIVELANGQIKFPATQSASSDANTLDDYEEGTWTPTLAFGGGSTGITYGTTVGTYTKVGRMVTCIAQLVLTSKGSSTGSATIASLPFTAASSSARGSIVFSVATSMTLTGQLLGRGVGAATTVDLSQLTAGTFAGLTETNFANNTQINFSFTYFV